MDKISMSSFVDFVLKTGTPKLTGVREFKERKDELYTDFYRQIREVIIDMHKTGKTPAVLDDFLAVQRDERRRRIYPSIAAGYRKFLASAEMKWFDPPVGCYRLGDIELNINPELGLVINGTPHLIKMYFRGEPLSAKRTSVILNLLMNTFADSRPGTTFAVLDVRNARLHSFKTPNPRLTPLLRGEAASFASIYNAL